MSRKSKGGASGDWASSSSLSRRIDLPPHDPDQFDLGGRQIDVRADHPQILADLPPRFGQRRVAGQHIVDRALGIARRQAEVQRRMGLRIEIDQADPLPRRSQGGARDSRRWSSCRRPLFDSKSLSIASAFSLICRRPGCRRIRPEL